MTPHDFVTWLKGIRDSFAPEAPPPIVWERIVAEIDKVTVATAAPRIVGPAIAQNTLEEKLREYERQRDRAQRDDPNDFSKSYPVPRYWLQDKPTTAVDPLQLASTAIAAVDEQMDAVGPKN